MELCTCELCSLSSEDLAGYIMNILAHEDYLRTDCGMPVVIDNSEGESNEPVTKDLT